MGQGRGQGEEWERSSRPGGGVDGGDAVGREGRGVGQWKGSGGERGNKRGRSRFVGTLGKRGVQAGGVLRGIQGAAERGAEPGRGSEREGAREAWGRAGRKEQPNRYRERKREGGRHLDNRVGWVGVEQGD